MGEQDEERAQHGAGAVGEMEDGMETRGVRRSKSCLSQKAAHHPVWKQRARRGGSIIADVRGIRAAL